MRNYGKVNLDGRLSRTQQFEESDDYVAEYFGTNKKRNFIGLILTGISLIIFMTAAWFSYKADVTTVSEEELPVIKADSNSNKIVPSDPGGMVVPNQDKLIYDTISVQKNTPKLERILPSPEEPVELSSLPSEPTEEKPAPKPESTIVSQPASSPKAIEPKAIEQAPKDNDQKILEAKAPEVKATETKATEYKLKLITEDKRSKSSFSRNESKTINNTLPKNGHFVQLASFKTEKEVKHEWERIKNRHHLDHLKMYIQTKNLPNKGIVYRLLVGPINSDSEARLVCKKLITKGQGCFVAKK